MGMECGDVGLVGEGLGAGGGALSVLGREECSGIKRCLQLKECFEGVY